MYSTVSAIIRKFLSLYEGEVREMYIDNRGLVTTGVGNLLSDPAAACQYQWEPIGGGGPVEPSDVRAEFNRVASSDTKAKIPDWATMGGGNFIAAAKKLGIVTLQLTTDSYRRIFTEKLAGLESTMKGTPGFEDYETYPADAQMGVLSVIWANGAGGFVGPRKEDRRLHKTWPNFTAACKRRAWLEIADRKHYRWQNIRADRDGATDQVFRNAQTTEDQLNANPATDATKVLYPVTP
jgi:hypothetical protein